MPTARSISSSVKEAPQSSLNETTVKVNLTLKVSLRFRQPDELVDRLPVVLPGLPVRPPLLVVVHQPLEAGVKLGSRLPQQQQSQGRDRPIRGVRLRSRGRKFELQM